jgi:hypothetical protein
MTNTVTHYITESRTAYLSGNHMRIQPMVGVTNSIGCYDTELFMGIKSFIVQTLGVFVSSVSPLFLNNYPFKVIDMLIHSYLSNS